MLIATTNPGKVREIRRALAGLSQLKTLADVAALTEPEETGLTFAENAALKARYYARMTGLPTVAEDSGLAIDALGGRPGVESARYPGRTYADKFAGLYKELAGAPRPWTARFVCSLAYVEPDDAGALRARANDGPKSDTAGESPIVFSAEGVVEGEIAPEPRGQFGFGYDPIFFYPPFGRTLGDVTDEEKLAVSHRGQAFRKFREWLEGMAR